MFKTAMSKLASSANGAAASGSTAKKRCVTTFELIDSTEIFPHLYSVIGLND